MRIRILEPFLNADPDPQHCCPVMHTNAVRYLPTKKLLVPTGLGGLGWTEIFRSANAVGHWLVAGSHVLFFLGFRAGSRLFFPEFQTNPLIFAITKRWPRIFHLNTISTQRWRIFFRLLSRLDERFFKYGAAPATFYTSHYEFLSIGNYFGLIMNFWVNILLTIRVAPGSEKARCPPPCYSCCVAGTPGYTKLIFQDKCD